MANIQELNNQLRTYEASINEKAEILKQRLDVYTGTLTKEKNILLDELTSYNTNNLETSDAIRQEMEALSKDIFSETPILDMLAARDYQLSNATIYEKINRYKEIGEAEIKKIDSVIYKITHLSDYIKDKANIAINKFFDMPVEDTEKLTMLDNLKLDIAFMAKSLMYSKTSKEYDNLRNKIDNNDEYKKLIDDMSIILNNENGEILDFAKLLDKNLGILVKELGMEYTPLESTLIGTFDESINIALLNKLKEERTRIMNNLNVEVADLRYNRNEIIDKMNQLVNIAWEELSPEQKQQLENIGRKELTIDEARVFLKDNNKEYQKLENQLAKINDKLALGIQKIDLNAREITYLQILQTQKVDRSLEHIQNLADMKDINNSIRYNEGVISKVFNNTTQMLGNSLGQRKSNVFEKALDAGKNIHEAITETVAELGQIITNMNIAGTIKDITIKEIEKFKNSKAYEFVKTTSQEVKEFSQDIKGEINNEIKELKNSAVEFKVAAKEAIDDLKQDLEATKDAAIELAHDLKDGTVKVANDVKDNVIIVGKTAKTGASLGINKGLSTVLDASRKGLGVVSNFLNKRVAELDTRIEMDKKAMEAISKSRESLVKTDIKKEDNER